jgi:hypothetical protein
VPLAAACGGAKPQRSGSGGSAGHLAYDRRCSSGIAAVSRASHSTTVALTDAGCSGGLLRAAGRGSLSPPSRRAHGRRKAPC